MSTSTLSSGYDQLDWIFFGIDYNSKIKWKNKLNSQNYIDYKNDLKEVSNSLRDNFIEWSTLVGKIHWNKWYWWITRLATRSNLISTLYLHLCYLVILKSILRDRKTPILIISDSWELINAIKFNWKKSFNIVIPKRSQQYFAYKIYNLNEQNKFILSWSIFILVSLYEWIIARLTKNRLISNKQKSHKNENLIVIHTCIDDDCLNDNGEFHDRYYPGLAKYLRDKGKNVITLTWLYNVKKKNKYQAFKWFRNNKEPFLIPQDYYNPVDSIISMFTVIKSSLLKIDKNILFESINVHHLILREQQLQSRSRSSAYFVNQMKVIRSFKKKGYKIDAYFDTWELKFCEVPALIALKQEYPLCLRIGYQHSAMIPKLQFCNYKTTLAEFNMAPHPDVCVTNGIVNYNYLKSEGIPESILHIGPALRYMYFKDKIPQKIKKYDEIFNILICTPFVFSSALEMLDVCTRAFVNITTKVNIRIKFHPMVPFEKIIKIVPLPKHFVITKLSMAEVLKDTDCLIVTDSATMVESVVKNIHTVIVGKETDIDQIPLELIEKSNLEIVNTSNELFEHVMKIKNNTINQTLVIEKEKIFEFSMNKLDKLVNI